jgi:hypothetical protein
MGMQLWKTTESKSFGNRRLIEFLEKHGAMIEYKQAMAVPASAFKAALDHPDEAGVTEQDIQFIKEELAGPRVDGSDADEDPDFDGDEDEIPVDVYDLW